MEDLHGPYIFLYLKICINIATCLHTKPAWKRGLRNYATKINDNKYKRLTLTYEGGFVDVVVDIHYVIGVEYIC